MNEFENVEKTIKKEKEFYAKVNYFSILLKLQCSKVLKTNPSEGMWNSNFFNVDYEKFCLLFNGRNSINQLLIDIEDKNIDLTDLVSEIWNQLLKDAATFNDPLYGKSALLVEALKDTKEIVQLLKIPVGGDKMMGIHFLYMQLPSEIKMGINLDDEMERADKKEKSKSKKIQER